jgi:fermentation-respiration switch protein FrsA (DUF1100 family)
MKAMAALALASALSLSSCVSAYFYDKAVARNSKDFIASSKDLSKQAKGPGAKDYSAWIKTQPYETVSIQSFDGLRLVGYYLPAASPSARTVILAHGYSSRGLHMSEFARFYSERLGYNVLMPDARGHGESEGDYIGFGWHERLDYLRWIDWVLGRAGADSRIVLHGISMGGATVLMASGEPLPPNVRAIVEDCGYTSAYDELAYQLRRMYGLGPAPIIPDTSKLTKERAGYTFEEASALDQVRKSRTPILFIHGDADTFVPFEMVRILYDACPSEKELFIVSGAGHGEAFGKDRQGYEAAVEAFLRKHS